MSRHNQSAGYHDGWYIQHLEYQPAEGQGFFEDKLVAILWLAEAITRHAGEVVY